MKTKLDLNKTYQQADKTPVRNLHYLPDPVLGAWPLRGEVYVNGQWTRGVWYADGSHQTPGKYLIPLIKETETPEFDPSLNYETIDGKPVKIYEALDGRIYYREGRIATSITIEEWPKYLRIKQPIKLGSLCMGVFEGGTYFGWYKGFDFERQEHILHYGSLNVYLPKARPVTHEDLDRWNA